MSKRVTRRRLLAGAAIPVAAVPLMKLAGRDESEAVAMPASHMGDDHASMGHAAMIGREVPAPGGPRALDSLLAPPPALRHEPGRVRSYTLVAHDR